MTGRRTDEGSEVDAESHDHTGATERRTEDGLSLPVVVCASGDSARVQAVNGAFEATFGTAEDVVGRPVVAVLASALDAAADDVRTAVQGAVDGGRPVLEAATDAGTDATDEGTQTVSGAFLLTYHAGDEATLARFLLDEVTAQRRRIRELEAERDRLVTLVHSFVHDIRNPLEVANIRLDVVRETGELSHLGEVEQAHDRIERLSDEMRSLADDSEVDDGAFVDTSVAQVARDAWLLVDTGEATLELEDALPTVRAVPSRLQRLFENLFRNSVEHGSGDGGATVETSPRVCVRSVEGGFVVEDDGPGIPPERRDRVFDRGFTTTEDGTGLGLAIARRVATRHGWELSVGESESGGTQIRVDL